jgi:sigma-B regulation protein RsbU (phosphoserine phosphatase)
MARRQFSIRMKLITVSTLLLVVVIGLFGVVNSMQSRRIIDDFSGMLQTKITDSLRQSGTSQLQLLAETARIALLQSDYSTLQTMVRDVGQQELVTAVGVVNMHGTVLAHSDTKRSGQPATGLMKKKITSEQVQLEPEVVVDGHKSIGFGVAVTMEGKQLATVFLAYSLEPLEKELVSTSEIKGREMTASLRNTLVVGLLAVLLGMLLTIIQSIGLSRPIRALARQADQMANGDLEAHVQIRSHDEIGFLGERFNYMADQMLVLMRETLAKATMEKELEVASAIQSTLVPDASVADLKRMKIAGYFKPATHCGGDWWSYYRLRDARSLVLVGDVTGHGVGAAMITAAAQGAVTTMLEVARGRIELGGLLRAMNAAIHAAAKGKFVMTCFASIYDPETSTLSFANAGHNFPYFFDAEGQNLASLVIRGNRLGDLVGSNYEVGEVAVKPGDGCFWYTDGIVECEDIRGEEYGERRFRAEIQRHANLPPDQALELIIGKAMEFYGEVPQKDDITVVVGKFA